MCFALNIANIKKIKQANNKSPFSKKLKEIPLINRMNAECKYYFKILIEFNFLFCLFLEPKVVDLYEFLLEAELQHYFNSIK